LPSLKTYHTFGIKVKCNELIRIASQSQLQEQISNRKDDYFILGGGSNILITDNLERPVLKNEIKGKEVVRETENHVFVKVGSGENWHRFVRYCIASNFGGVENLSLIPGTVGAAPMQNIGAYGVEIDDVFDSLEAVNLKSGKVRKFTSKTCEFGYRSSVFKTSLKGKYFITSVTFKLTKKEHKLNLGYGAISKRLQEGNNSKPSIRDVSDIVISIRESKLPNPRIIGNAGSFFKNPIITAYKAKKVKGSYAKTPLYKQSDGSFKISAGWLIEQCGWKGKSVGGAACYKKHALILINDRMATSEDVIELSKAIQRSVKEQFNILLEPEVNFIS